MQTTEFKLTDLEAACGVTIEQVQHELPRCLLKDGRVTVDKDLPPALATAVARCALGIDKPGTYYGRNLIGRVFGP